jgi:hypothetical protein
MVKGFEGLAEKDFFSRGDGKGSPPGEVLVGEWLTRGQLQHVAVKQAVKAVAGHGLDPDQAAAMGEQAASLTGVEGWNPNLGDGAGGAQLGELDGVMLVGLDPGFGDPGELAGVGNLDRCDKGDDTVIEIPGIGGGFDGEDIGGDEMIASLGGPIIEGDFERFEDNLLEGIDGGDIEEVFARPGGLGQGGDRRRRTG